MNHQRPPGALSVKSPDKDRPDLQAKPNTNETAEGDINGTSSGSDEILSTMSSWPPNIESESSISSCVLATSKNRSSDQDQEKEIGNHILKWLDTINPGTGWSDPTHQDEMYRQILLFQTVQNTYGRTGGLRHEKILHYDSERIHNRASSPLVDILITLPEVGRRDRVLDKLQYRGELLLLSLPDEYRGQKADQEQDLLQIGAWSS